MEILNGIVFNPQPTARKRTSKPQSNRQVTCLTRSQRRGSVPATPTRRQAPCFVRAGGRLSQADGPPKS
jgi:hypothetical protein